jgi:DNA-directed RNA polymerase specialized sigma24 family protein
MSKQVMRQVEMIIGTDGMTKVNQAISSRLFKQYGKTEHRDELESWAALGSTLVMSRLDLTVKTARGVTVQEMSQSDQKLFLITYLKRYGYCQALEEMRKANVIGRCRNNHWYGGSVLMGQIPELTTTKDGKAVPLEIADEQGAHGIAEADFRDLVGMLCSKLNGFELQVFVLHYCKNFPLSQIPQALKISESHMYNTHRRVLAYIRSYLTGGLRHFCPS